MTVDGVATRPGATPFDLILGESINKGWTATVGGGPGLGKPVLIDAFANGWRIDPTAVAPYVHDGKLDVTIEWTPQRTVDWALLVSAVAIVACLVLALWPVGRRRRRRHARAHAGSDTSDVATSTDSAVAEAVALDEQAEAPAPVRLRGSPGVGAGGARHRGSRRSRRRRGGHRPGGAGGRRGHRRGAVGAAPPVRAGDGAVGCVAAAGIFVAVHQGQLVVPDNGAWPRSFGTASQWAWAGVVFLGADGAVDVALRARRRRLDRRTGDGDDAGETVATASAGDGTVARD